MKINWNKKYTTIAVYALIVIAVAVLFVVFVFKFESFAKGFGWIGAVAAPLICGIVIAYIINPLVMYFENKVFARLKYGAPAEKNVVLKKLEESPISEKRVVKDIEKGIEKLAPTVDKKIRRRRTAARALSITLAYVVTLSVIAGICIAVVPSLAGSVVELADHMSGYVQQLNDFIKQVFANNPEVGKLLSDEIVELSTIVNKIANIMEPMAGDIIGSVSSGLLSFAASVFTALKNVLIGLIIAIYLLFSKERLLAQIKKILFAFLNNSTCRRIFYAADKSNDIFKKYIISNLLDALIIFSAMTFGMLIMGMPYPMLLSVVCGVTNLIPFFGPFIGAIPCAVVILLVDPIKVIWFCIFVLVLQQVDGNIIKPHLFGETMGLPAIWVLVSITLGGGMFGIAGMLLGAPVFAVIYLLFAEFVAGRLKRKNMPDETLEYTQDTSRFTEEPGEEEKAKAPPAE